MFCRFLVNRLAHIFRPSDLPLFSVLSLPAGRLDTLRMQGRPGELSDSRLYGWNLLRSLGLGPEDPPS